MHNMLRRFSLPLLLAFSALLLAACGANNSRSGAHMVESQTQEQYGPIDNSVVIRSHDVTVYQRSDKTAQIGNGVPICLKVHSNCSSAHVRVISSFDENEAEFVKAEPEAKVEDGQVVWEWEHMHANESEDLTLWLAPLKGGDLVICTSLQVLPTGCISMSCGTPELSIDKEGPSEVVLGCDAEYTITVKNVGTLTVEDVCLKDIVPEGFTHSSGREVIGYRIGDLSPGEEGCVPLSFQAVKKGEWCNVATAISSNAPEVSAEACTRVICHEIAVEKSGTEEQKVGNQAYYEIIVSNPGEDPITEVVVKDFAPEKTTIVNAPGATVEGNCATWNIEHLDAGDSKRFELSLVGSCPGESCNIAEVTCCEGCEDADKAYTEWEGSSQLALCLTNCEDPLMLGCETSWTIQVCNKGSAASEKVDVAIRFPPGLQPKEVDGPTEGSIDGRTIIFDTLESIDCNECYEWTVSVRAISLGEQTVKAKVISNGEETMMEEKVLMVY